MGLLRVTVQVRVVEFPSTTLMRIAVTCTSGGTVLEQVAQHKFPLSSLTGDGGIESTNQLVLIQHGVCTKAVGLAHIVG